MRWRRHTPFNTSSQSKCLIVTSGVSGHARNHVAQWVPHTKRVQLPAPRLLHARNQTRHLSFYNHRTGVFVSGANANAMQSKGASEKN